MQTFEGLTYWLKQLSEKVDKDNMLLFVAGNKCDVNSDQKQVRTAKAKEFAEENNMFFLKL